MKANKTQKPSQDIRNNSLFTNMTAEEEVFVRGGAAKNNTKGGRGDQYDESGPGIVHRK